MKSLCLRRTEIFHSVIVFSCLLAISLFFLFMWTNESIVASGGGAVRCDAPINTSSAGKWIRFIYEFIWYFLDTNVLLLLQAGDANNNEAINISSAGKWMRFIYGFIWYFHDINFLHQALNWRLLRRARRLIGTDNISLGLRNSVRAEELGAGEMGGMC